MAKTEKAIVKQSGPATLAKVSSAQGAFEGAMQGMLDLLKGNPNPETVALVERTMKNWEEALKDNRSTAKEILLAYTTEHGTVEEAGSLNRVVEIEVAGSPVTLKKQVSRHSKPDESKLKKLLAKKKIDFKLVYVRVVTRELDMDKLKDLIEDKKLTADEVDACRNVKSTSLIIEGM